MSKGSRNPMFSLQPRPGAQELKPCQINNPNRAENYLFHWSLQALSAHSCTTEQFWGLSKETGKSCFLLANSLVLYDLVWFPFLESCDYGKAAFSFVMHALPYIINHLQVLGWLWQIPKWTRNPFFVSHTGRKEKSKARPSLYFYLIPQLHFTGYRTTLA